jgi:hypothetical protein
LNAARHLIIFDVDQLLELVNNGLTTRSFRHVVLAARAILERSAITVHHLEKLRDLFQKIDDNLSASRYAKGILSREQRRRYIEQRYLSANAVRQYLNAQSFNWELGFGGNGRGEIGVKKGDSKKQFAAGKAIQGLGWIGPAPKDRNLYWHYSLLCDFVHPNFGASSLFVDVQESLDIWFPSAGRGNRLYRKLLARRPDHLSAVGHVVQVIYLPLREALLHTSAHVNWLTTEQQKRYRELRSFEKLKQKTIRLRHSQSGCAVS